MLISVEQSILEQREKDKKGNPKRLLLKSNKECTKMQIKTKKNKFDYFDFKIKI